MKEEYRYFCQSCGAESLKWQGKCAQCGEWGTLVQERMISSPGRGRREKRLARDSSDPASQAVLLKEVEEQKERRLPSGLGEVDRVLGGGLVAGSVILLSGEPGIGKSTLLLQVSHHLSQANRRVLYVSAEESVYQIKLRGERLGIQGENLYLLGETDVLSILAHLRDLHPHLVIVDSIQMIYHPNIPSAPGSVSQVRECASELVRATKSTNSSLFLIGHITKEGVVAGPKTLEHIVDVVCTFEGEQFHTYRILRSLKNRFGPTREIGIFDMTREGLVEVSNPSELFLLGRPRTSGSCIFPALLGTRPLLVEVQALSSKTFYPTPTRRVTGADLNRVQQIVAVLEKRTGLYLGQQDVFVNVVGGVEVEEPASDLAVAMAIASNFKESPLEDKSVFFGEIGLGGEIRPVTQAVPRLQEAQRLGFARAYLPRGNQKGIQKEDISNVELVFLENLAQTLKMV